MILPPELKTGDGVQIIFVTSVPATAMIVNGIACTHDGKLYVVAG